MVTVVQYNTGHVHLYTMFEIRIYGRSLVRWKTMLRTMIGRIYCLNRSCKNVGVEFVFKTMQNTGSRYLVTVSFHLIESLILDVMTRQLIRTLFAYAARTTCKGKYKEPVPSFISTYVTCTFQ